jgi:ribosomal subunit interface protein
MQQNLTNSNIALKIQFRHMPKSKEIKQVVRQQIESFNSSAAPGSRCTVIFDHSHSSQHGTVYEVAIRLHIPGHQLYVVHTSESGGSKELLFAALNNAFHSLHRQIRKARTKRYHHRRLAA